jgi:hypothetical protein
LEIENHGLENSVPKPPKTDKTKCQNHPKWMQKNHHRAKNVTHVKHVYIQNSFILIHFPQRAMPKYQGAIDQQQMSDENKTCCFYALDGTFSFGFINRPTKSFSYQKN